MDFHGSPEDYKHLKACLETLHDMGKTSTVLLKAVDAPEVRHTLDRFRKGQTVVLSRHLAESLWTHVRITYPLVFEMPGLFKDGVDTDDMLFALLKRFFELKPPKIADFAEAFGGNYVCYTLSSMKYPNPYVTVSEMNITQTKTGVLQMTETQQYVAKGNLLTEIYSGFCMPKGTSKIMLAHDKEHNSRPRMYYITDDMDTEINGKAKKAFFKGFVIAYSKNYGGAFQCNFFCRRLTSGQRVEKDIIPRNELDDEDVDEWIFPTRK
ncbi:MAG: hypothetical protein KDJ74_04465 [Notoacmeibacter sp.]|nr:hypothetical protein [Notoacmeibacter sp.]